jgi:hemolysin activation/secretion protein
MKSSTTISAALFAMLICPRVFASEAGVSSGAGQIADEEADRQAQQAAPQPGFNVWEFRVTGNTLLEKKLIERTVYPLLGEQRNIDTVEEARSALEAQYRKAGYPTVLVDIPEQDVRGGIVKLAVTEGRIDRLRITGSRYYSLGRIRSGVPGLAPGNVPKLSELQAELGRLAEQSQDRKITPVMRAGRTPGTLEVELKVEDKLPLHGSLEINGRNSANTSRSRLSGSLRYDNLWQRFHSASVQFQTAPENTDEVQVLAGTYVFPVGDSRSRIALYGVKSESESEVASAGALAVLGKGTIVGARVVNPLSPLDNYFHSFISGADYKDFDENVVLTGADTFATPISYMPFTLRYEGGWRDGEKFTSFGVGLDFALRNVGSDQQEFENKRIYSKSNYAILSGKFETLRPLGNGMQVFARLKGQLANSPLISNEQFSAGGAESVRGYYESQRLGDDGISGTLELRSPQLAADDSKLFRELRFHGFLDAARLRVREALPGTPERYELAGAGAGVRFHALHHIQGALDFAYPLIAADPVDKGDLRVDFTLGYEF